MLYSMNVYLGEGCNQQVMYRTKLTKAMVDMYLSTLKVTRYCIIDTNYSVHVEE